MNSTTHNRRARGWLLVALAGLAGAGATLLIGTRVALYGYLTAFIFWLGVPLGCAGLLMTHRLTGGRWGWSVLRPARAAVRTAPLLAVAFLPVALGLWRIYPWAAGPVEPGNPLMAFRRFYLTPWFFLTRAALFLGIWIVGALWMLGRRRTTDGGLQWTPRSPALAAGGLIVLVLTVTLAGADWIGSLTRGWYSSITGFYMLTSFGLTGVAVLILAATRADHDGEADPDILQDLGNLLLTFVILHAYMAFSQFLIMWNGNEPAEIQYYAPRAGGVWTGVAVLVVVIQFFLPLLTLIVRSVKRRRRGLAAVAWLVLASQAAEAAWLVLPSLTLPGHAAGMAAALGAIPAVASFVGLGGLWMAWFERSRQAAAEEGRA